MNYDESKVSKPKVKKPKAPEPIKLVDDSPSWTVFLFLVVFVIIGVSLATYIKRPSVTTPVDPAAIEQVKPADPLEPGQSWKEPGSARDTFNQNFNR
jgi:hypothetical protein